MPRGRISPRTKKTARPKRAGKGSRRAKPAGLLPLQIANRTYAALKDQPVLITPELKQTLEKRKLRDGTRAFDNLVRMGFRGGKHLLELIREQLGPACQVVLSHEDSAVSPSRMFINYETFRQAGQQRFFEVYRQTGLLTATQFLNDAFPETFTRTAEDSLPEVRDVKRVLRSLPQAAEAVPRRDRAEIPDRIAELVERQGAEFAFSLLSSVDAAIPRGQEQIRARFQEVVGRLASEPKALAELTALMDEWNLLQVTSLLSVLKTRLNTIATFETLISDEGSRNRTRACGPFSGRILSRKTGNTPPDGPISPAWTRWGSEPSWSKSRGRRSSFARLRSIRRNSTSGLSESISPRNGP